MTSKINLKLKPSLPYSSSASEIKTGTKVRTKFTNGKKYKGVINNIYQNAGGICKVNILYDDGDSEICSWPDTSGDIEIVSSSSSSTKVEKKRRGQSISSAGGAQKKKKTCEGYNKLV